MLTQKTFEFKIKVRKISFGLVNEFKQRQIFTGYAYDQIRMP